MHVSMHVCVRVCGVHVLCKDAKDCNNQDKYPPILLPVCERQASVNLV